MCLLRHPGPAGLMRHAGLSVCGWTHPERHVLMHVTPDEAILLPPMVHRVMLEAQGSALIPVLSSNMRPLSLEPSLRTALQCTDLGSHPPDTARSMLTFPASLPFCPHQSTRMIFALEQGNFLSAWFLPIKHKATSTALNVRITSLYIIYDVCIVHVLCL